MCSAAVVRNIRHDVGNVTAQNATKHVDGVGADALTALQAGDLRRADAVLLDERMLCDAFARHGELQVFVGDHNIQAPLST